MRLIRTLLARLRAWWAGPGVLPGTGWRDEDDRPF